MDREGTRTETYTINPLSAMRYSTTADVANNPAGARNEIERLRTERDALAARLRRIRDLIPQIGDAVFARLEEVSGEATLEMEQPLFGPRVEEER